MASLVLGAAGAVVGSFFGPLGTSIGWALGSALGNALSPTNSNGPRLTDLHLQNSSYGQAIPIVYGTVRIAGDVIWETDLQEHSQKTGGKGGPTVTTYTYTASYAVLLCEGPIGGVLRIWANGRLVWDPTSMDPTDFPFTLYLGDEVQLPDPTIEAVEGVGNVPGHRGTAYVVFTDQLLTDFGNVLPSLTFEVFAAGGPIPWRYAGYRGPNNDNRAGNAGSGPQSGMLDPSDPTRLLISYVETQHNGTQLHAMPQNFYIDAYDLITGAFIENILTQSMLPPDGGTTLNSLVWCCAENVHIAFQHRSIRSDTDQFHSGLFYDGIEVVNPVIDPITMTPGNTNPAAFAISSQPHYNNERVYACGGSTIAGATQYVAWWSAPGGIPISNLPGGFGVLPGPEGSAPEWGVAPDSVTDDIWVLMNTDYPGAFDHIQHFDADLNFIESFDITDFPGLDTLLAGPAHAMAAWNGYVSFTCGADGDHTCLTFSRTGVGNTWEMTDPGFVVFVNTSPAPDLGNMISLGNGLIYVGDGIVSLQPQSQQVTLASIVSDLSVRAGLTTNQIDVTELTDLVDGYVVPNQSDVRSLITPLQVAWPFDAVEHDVVVYFKRRRRPQVDAEIPLIDLGCYAYPGEPPAYLVVDPREQEVDLPKILDVTFFNKETDYQNGEQRAQRAVSISQLTTSVQLPIVMDNDKAHEVAESRLYEAWIEREKFKVQLARNWLGLEPGDVIIAGERTMRITQSHQNVDGVLLFDCAATSLQLYYQAAPAPAGVGMPGSGGNPPTPPPVLQETDLILLDIPLIHDTDNALGYYAAMAGHAQVSWAGATIYKSIDGGVTYDPLLTDTVSDTFGDCLTTLGDFQSGNIFDETNTLTVQLSIGSGTLASVSRIAVLNGANMAVVGTPGTSGVRNIEVIQFRDATLTGTRTYILSGLRRGRRGSDWMMPSHVASEKFVLLPTSTNVLGLTTEVGLIRKFRAVTSGRPLSSAAIVDFMNYGIATRPYAPVCLGGARDPATGDYTLRWRRRTRIGGTWVSFVDVPLSETIERYQVHIYSDNSYTTLLRSENVDNVQEYDYTVAKQTTDFGSPPSSVNWGVAQLGTYYFGTERKESTYG